MKHRENSSVLAGKGSAFAGLKYVVVALVALLAVCGLSGCLVAGYSSRGGGFIWPGGFGLVLLLLLLLFLLRRGR